MTPIRIGDRVASPAGSTASRLVRSAALCGALLALQLATSAATRSVPSQYSTIQAAVNAAASGDIIQIAAGNYNEAVTVPSSKSKINLQGAGKTATRIYVGSGQDALTVLGTDILIKNLTVENTGGQNAGQQQAVYTQGTKITFSNCLIKGWQDTLQMKQGSQQYFYKCEIQGSVDYIYDGGTAFFDQCTTVQRRVSPTGPVDAAPAAPAGVRGIIFWKCNITAASGVTASSSYLARVWKAPGEVAYINCTIGSHIKSVGYLSWNEGTTSRVAEYPCPSSRASWCKRLTSTSGYTITDILGSWTPRL